jgi:hypothetical protein
MLVPCENETEMYLYALEVVIVAGLLASRIALVWVWSCRYVSQWIDDLGTLVLGWSPTRLTGLNGVCTLYRQRKNDRSTIGLGGSLAIIGRESTLESTEMAAGRMKARISATQVDAFLRVARLVAFLRLLQ